MLAWAGVGRQFPRNLTRMRKTPGTADSERFPKSELAGQAGHFENEICLFLTFLLKPFAVVYSIAE